MLTENYFNILIFLFLFFLVFALAELLYIRKIPQYITRKVVHMGGGLVTVFMPLFVTLKTFVILGIGFFLLLLISKQKKFLNSIHKMKSESNGAILFAPSLVLTGLIFWPINIHIFQGATLVLALSDGIAGIIGNKYGRKKYKITGNKTIEGSLVFFLITVLIFLGILYISDKMALSKIIFVLLGSLTLTIIEAVFSKGWDNLFIPLASGIFLFFILR